MIARSHLESLLKVNGLTKSAPDDEIRSMLISARFKGNEVETAMMVLRENPETKETKVDGLHKVFRSDQSLKPAEISKLLGINVDIKELVRSEEIKMKNNYSSLQMLAVWVAALAVAASTMLFYMYLNHVGLFHPTMNVALYAE